MRPSETKSPGGALGARQRSKALRLAMGSGLTLAVALGSLAAAGDVSTSTTAAPTTTTSTTASTTTTAAPTTSTTATTAAPTTAPAAPTTAAPTTAGPTTTAAQSTTADSGSTTTIDAAGREERARAVANLNLARSADIEIASSLKAINEEANLTIEKIALATERIEIAQAIAARSMTELEESGDKQRQIETALMVKAVEGFKTRSLGSEGSGILGEATVNETLRQNQLLDQASSSTTELLEELRTLLEDRQFANSEAEQAARDALEAEEVLQAELEKLKEQQTVQVGLKVEAERRIGQWAAELTAYAQEDAAIQALISENAAPAVVNTAINNPTTPSALGFQWPVEAPVTSEYGYRNHPVFGKRKFHNGIDLGAGRGTAIATSNDGVVIFAGSRSGYGNTVIVDHGGGITTLYAHMSELGATDGQTVSRGDIVGFVGKTGTATGYHLHFEVRVNGGSVNPRNYLP